MRYRDAAAFRQALEQRLKTRAGGDGARLARDRKRIVFDRLLSHLDAATLRGAIESTFARRATHPIPAALPAPPADWIPQYRQLAGAVGIAEELSVGHAEAAALLDLILSGEVKVGTWDPESRRWVSGR